MAIMKLQNMSFERGGKVARYRRRWPVDIIEMMDGDYYSHNFKNKSGPAMIREYGVVDAQFEKVVATMRQRKKGDERTSAQVFRDASKEAAKMLDEVIGIESDDQWLRGHLADATPNPVVKEILTNPKAKEPKATVADGLKLYRQLRVKGDRQKETRLKRLEKRLEVVWGDLGALELVNLRRAHGRDLVAHFVNHKKDNGEPLSAESIAREVGQAKAVIALSIKENDLTGKVANPLDDVELPEVSGRVDEKRRPLTDEEVVKVTKSVEAVAASNPELMDIWSLLSLGCHAKEICFLEVQDIDIERSVLKVRGNSLRGRLKTKSRDRDIPLTPNSRVAVQRALKRREDEGVEQSAPLFPRYAKNDRSADSLTQTINTKHIKPIGIDATTYGMRHRASMKLRSAGAEQAVIDRALGHSQRGAGASTYGGDERVEQVREWFVKAGL